MAVQELPSAYNNEPDNPRKCDLLPLCQCNGGVSILMAEPLQALHSIKRGQAPSWGLEDSRGKRTCVSPASGGR